MSLKIEHLSDLVLLMFIPSC